MAHVVLVEDSVTGDLVDLLVYCSDSCAQTNTSYAGWYGCYENTTEPFCQNDNCRGELVWLNEEENAWYVGLAQCELVS